MDTQRMPTEAANKMMEKVQEKLNKEMKDPLIKAIVLPGGVRIIAELDD